MLFVLGRVGNRQSEREKERERERERKVTFLKEIVRIHRPSFKSFFVLCLDRTVELARSATTDKKHKAKMARQRAAKRKATESRAHRRQQQSPAQQAKERMAKMRQQQKEQGASTKQDGTPAPSKCNQEDFLDV